MENLRKQLKLQVTILTSNNVQLYWIKFSYRRRIIFRLIDAALTCIYSAGENGQGNKRVFYTSKLSKTGAYPLYSV